MSERLESILLLTENSILFFSIPKTWSDSWNR
jgi:hypothetical protein